MNNKRLRVLHVTFNMGFGGTEQVIRQLIVNIGHDSGIESEVLCTDGQVGPIGQALESEGVTVHKATRGQGLDWSLVRVIRQRLKEGQFDIVHCHQYTPWVYGWLAASFTRVNVIFTEHGRFYPDRYRYKTALINPVMALLTQAIVAISSATRDALSRYEFVPKRKIELIYNGITPLESDKTSVEALRTELKIPSDADVVGTVSRLDPVKNQTMMLRAFKMLLDQHPASWLVIVGDGPSRHALEKLADDLKIAHRITFTGFISAPVNYLALMKVFLLSSHTEGTSMTLLEAMSLGIPIVATNVGGNPEILGNGESGVLVPGNDAQAFYQATLRLISEEDFRKKKSQAATLAFRQKFSGRTMANQYATLYKSICE